MSFRIDSIDARILELLQEDGRMSSTEMVRRLGDVTERIVRHRIKRMVEEQIIRISAILNPAAIGFGVTADVWVETEASATTKLAAALTELEQISYVSYSTGDQNISLQVHAINLAELHHYVNEVISSLPGVRRTTITIIPFTLKDIDQWKIPGSVIRR
ncbi:MAG: Lrp/AsnC family transcriptional regulator [Anaerolineaceae bacterium]|nr:Lrp/AsnC family transcriptional regulator [Anaerolineaceae bacterium]